MIIKSFIKTSLVDYPGQIASSLFLGGCNFRCPWCHNLDLIAVHPEEEAISPEEILYRLEKRKKIIRHVCISGGEPTIWGEELVQFCTALKRIGFKVKLDTNGSHPELLKNLIQRGYLDFIAMDVKNIPERYAETVGMDVNPFPKIEESIDIIKNSGLPHQFRTTIVPNLVNPDEIRSIANRYGIEITLQAFREQF